MNKIQWIFAGLLLWTGAAMAEQYYQADPAKLAAMEAERCKGYEKEKSLIQRRLGGPVNRPADVKKMKDKLATLDNLIAQKCTAPGTKR